MACKCIIFLYGRLPFSKQLSFDGPIPLQFAHYRPSMGSHMIVHRWRRGMLRAPQGSPYSPSACHHIAFYRISEPFIQGSGTLNRRLPGGHECRPTAQYDNVPTTKMLDSTIVGASPQTRDEVPISSTTFLWLTKCAMLSD